jgi:DNA-binding MarR family transcriptional regulator
MRTESRSRVCLSHFAEKCNCTDLSVVKGPLADSLGLKSRLPVNQPKFLDCTCSAVSQTARRIHRIYDAHLVRHGLSIGQFGMLSHVRHFPGLTRAELAAYNAMDPSTVSRLTRPLLDRELIVSRSDPEDGRVHRLTLTALGQDTHAAALKSWEAAQAELEQRIGAAKDLAFRRLMHELVEAL